ncbi:hypothetical protein [Halorussus salinus]|uniref:hypothetical protein n=1 Tax=Halorussus salinus TaxID=1364935 RepID=UPI001091C0D1|nr:hypothetical protein [Halorussus salinus]
MAEQGDTPETEATDSNEIIEKLPYQPPVTLEWEGQIVRVTAYDGYAGKVVFEELSNNPTVKSNSLKKFWESHRQEKIRKVEAQYVGEDEVVIKKDVLYQVMDSVSNSAAEPIQQLISEKGKCRSR